MPRPIRAPTKSIGGGASLKTLNRTNKTAPPARKQTKASIISTETSKKATSTTTRPTRSTQATKSTDFGNASSEDIESSQGDGNTQRSAKQNSSFMVEVPTTRSANRLNRLRSTAAVRRTTSLRSKGDVSPKKSSPLKTSPVKTRMVSLEATQESTQQSFVGDSQQSVVPETPPKRRKVTENDYVESSPLPSSEQENRSPSPRSSPPPLPEPLGVSTPLQTTTAGRFMRYGSEDGFTPPPPSRRLPLQEVRLRKATSPVRLPHTPSRTSTQRSRNIWSETDTCGSTPAAGQGRVEASPFFPRRFTPADFEVFEDETATRTPPHRRATKRDSNGAAKTPSPVQPKNAATSAAEPEFEASEGSDAITATPPPKVTKRTRAVAAATKKAAVMPTTALQALLPRKRAPTKKKIVKRVVIDSDGNSQEVYSQTNEDEEGDIYDLNVESDEDELSTRRTVRKGKAAAAPKKGRKAAATQKATKAKTTAKTAGVKKTTTKEFQPVLPKRFAARTYGKKTVDGTNKEQAEPEEGEQNGDDENEAPEPTQGTENLEEAVQKVKEHFKEIDAWELDFETVSNSTD
ncbi:hypothetical protein BJ508DRAFT_410375 [Ascobolus immersus RN42]|uniref:Uncharacterized protein n=1 Tax=Ascobolus immersus RN42 TaxID=1160509 RepID=A0A3N4J117_ASCIM|nr:hypothetical protein BJ508DRAFT_410375 [Ascobolus immersus RN42]